MDPQQQRRHFLYTTRNTPPQGPLLGSPGGGACQRGFLEPQKEYSWLSSGVDPWYMCTRCPNKGEIMVDGQEPRAGTQGTDTGDSGSCGNCASHLLQNLKQGPGPPFHQLASGWAGINQRCSWPGDLGTPGDCTKRSVASAPLKSNNSPTGLYYSSNVAAGLTKIIWLKA